MRTLIFITFLSMLISSLMAATVEETKAAKKFMEDKIKSNSLTLNDLDKDFKLGDNTFNYSQFSDLAEGFIAKTFKEMGKEDARQLFQNYLVGHEDIQKDTEKFKAECPAKTSTCSDRLKQRSFTLSIVNAMFQSIEKTEQSFFESNMCTFRADLLPNQDFWSQFVDFNKNKDKCDPLETNEQRVVLKDQFQQDYLIRKVANNKHQIVLNLDFRYLNGGVSSVEMMNRVRGCLKDANPNLGSEDNQLEIVALTPDEAKRDKTLNSLRPAKISLEGPNFRSHSASYSDAADCTTIVHETLHLLGLCDEYPERDTSLFDATCRIITTQDSIMRNKDQALARAQERQVECKCEASSNCGRVMNSTNENAKRIFLGETDNEIMDGWFKSDYCKFGETKQITPTDDKTVVMKSETNDSFTVGVRSVGSWETGGLYFHETTVSCTFKPYAFTPAELHPEELERFKASKEIIKQRMAASPRRGGCPRGSDEISSKNKMEGNPGASLRAGVLTVNKDAEGPLLSPNHITRILAGNCETVASNYRQCAKLGYDSIKKCNKNARVNCSEDNFLNNSGDASPQ